MRVTLGVLGGSVQDLEIEDGQSVRRVLELAGKTEYLADGYVVGIDDKRCDNFEQRLEPGQRVLLIPRFVGS